MKRYYVEKNNLKILNRKKENIKPWNYQLINTQHNARYKLYYGKGQNDSHTFCFFWNHSWVSWPPKSWGVFPHLFQLSQKRSTFSSVDLLAPGDSISCTYEKHPGKSRTKKLTFSVSKVKPEWKKKKKAQSLKEFKNQSYSGQMQNWSGPPTPHSSNRWTLEAARSWASIVKEEHIQGNPLSALLWRQTAP